MWFAVSAERVGQNILINNSENKKYRRYGCTGKSLYSRIFVRIAKNASLLYNDKIPSLTVIFGKTSQKGLFYIAFPAVLFRFTI